MQRYRLIDYWLRSVTTMILALAIVGVAAYDELVGHRESGPFRDWAGLVVGVYFGAHVAFNASGTRRRAGDDAPHGQQAS